MSETYTIPRSGDAPLSFVGDVITDIDGEYVNGQEQTRWHAIAIYRTEENTFVAHVGYHSKFRGEASRDTAAAVATAPEVVSFLRSYDPVADVQGYPPGPAHAEKQQRLVDDIRRRYQGQMSAAVGGPIFYEKPRVVSERKNFRLGQDAMESIGRLQTAHSYKNQTEAVEESVQCWDMALTLAAEEVSDVFDRAEWNAISAANNASDFDHRGSRPGMTLGANVEDTYRLGRLGPWLEDEIEGEEAARVRHLVKKLWDLPFAQGWAVARAVCWFWAHPQLNDIDATVDPWWTVEFRRKCATRKVLPKPEKEE